MMEIGLKMACSANPALSNLKMEEVPIRLNMVNVFPTCVVSTVVCMYDFGLSRFGPISVLCPV